MKLILSYRGHPRFLKENLISIKNIINNYSVIHVYGHFWEDSDIDKENINFFINFLNKSSIANTIYSEKSYPEKINSQLSLPDNYSYRSRILSQILSIQKSIDLIGDDYKNRNDIYVLSIRSDVIVTNDIANINFNNAPIFSHAGHYLGVSDMAFLYPVKLNYKFSKIYEFFNKILMLTSSFDAAEIIFSQFLKNSSITINFAPISMPSILIRSNDSNLYPHTSLYNNLRQHISRSIIRNLPYANQNKKDQFSIDDFVNSIHKKYFLYKIIILILISFIYDFKIKKQLKDI